MWKWKQPISREIFEKKYLFDRKDIKEVFSQVANVISSAEKTKKKKELYNKKFFDIMWEGKFIPAGRILANAYPDSKIENYMNCYTIDINDDISDIFDSLKKDALISKSGGGVGFDISKLRPKNYPLSVGGVSSGPISFLKIFDASAKTIMTGGNRRSAHIALLDISHPDIEEFITCKQGDENKELTQFNISVKITDKFINAVKKDLDWDLVFNGKVCKTVKAKYLYNLLVKNAYKYNEPGIFNVDIVNKYNNGWNDFDINAVNPCVTGDTIVAVADGRNGVSIKQLAEEGKDIPVYCKDNNGKTVIRMMRNPRITGYDKDIYEVTLDDGSTIKCTGNHKLMLKDQSYKEVKNLVGGESLKITTKYKTTFSEKIDSFKNKEYWKIYDGNKTVLEHRKVYEELVGNIKKGNVIHHKDSNSLNNNILNLQLMSKKEHDNYHAHMRKGKNNPYHNMSDDWKKKFASHPGEQNGSYSGYTNEQIINIMKNWIKENDKILTLSTWKKLAKKKGYPFGSSKFRKNSFNNLIKFANTESGKNHFDNRYDVRNYNRYLEILKSSDLDIYFKEGSIFVKKRCEHCNKEFSVEYGKREISFCSWECSKPSIYKKRKNTIIENTEKKHQELKSKIYDLFSKFVNKNKKIPTNKEFISILQKNNINDLRSAGFSKSYTKFIKNIFTKFDINQKVSTQALNYNNNNCQEIFAKKLIDQGMVYNHKVISVKKIGKQTVYNGTVDEFHNFATILNVKKLTKSGRTKLEFIYSCQCGEIPMSPYNVCCLGAVNLTKFVEHPFSTNATFNYTDFEKIISYGIRFLDNVLSMSKYPLKEIQKNVDNYRRIGLGFTGLGDAFAMLGIQYGSKDSKEFSSYVAQTLRDTSYLTSSCLAKEKGKFKKYNKNKILQSNFIKNIKSTNLAVYNYIKKYGLRNIALNTCAPTGTISFSIGQNCSSGIEPIFALEYNRRIRIEGKDKWKEETVYDYAYLLFKEMFPDKELPKFFIVSSDVNPKDAIDIQSIFQKYIDNSISKTHNLAPGTSFKDYKDLFLYAYEKGLKGFTSFNPDGAMKGILSTNEPKKNDDDLYIERHTAPIRPNELECDIHQTTFEGKKYIVLIGKYNGSLYEIFVDEDKNNKIDIGKHKIGIIKKIKKGKYDLIVRNGEDKTIVENLSKTFGGINGTLARMISMSLRHGTPLQFIVGQLSKSNEFHTFDKVVSRVLKKYIKNGEKVMTSDVCLECGQELIYKDGCIMCSSCGWSKCS